MDDTFTQPGDVVLVYMEEEPAFFARVEEILFDVKPGWRNFRFKMLAFPIQDMTWTLEPSQIDGKPFTMGGVPIKIERLPDPEPAVEESAEAEEDKEPEVKSSAKVIRFPSK